MPGKFLGTVSQDPSDFKSNRLHVDIFRVALFIQGIFNSPPPRMINNFLWILQLQPVIS